ncbi:unnamed protein product, partial [marine sediment metagenome]
DVCIAPILAQASINIGSSGIIGRYRAIHTVIFSGFSSQALADRLNDIGAKVLIT